MSGKKVTTDFGTVFTSCSEDTSVLVQQIEKAAHVNTQAIIEEGAYKHRQNPEDKPMRLKVTVELVEA